MIDLFSKEKTGNVIILNEYPEWLIKADTPVVIKHVLEDPLLIFMVSYNFHKLMN